MPGRLLQLSCAMPLLLAALSVAAADKQYTIKEGETLYSVAKRAQVPVDVLSAYNGVPDPSRVKAGLVLKIPTVYTVKKGDTLYGIARTFGVPMGKLTELNRLDHGGLLRIGERIYIPADVDVPAVAVGEASERPSRTDSTSPDRSAPSAFTVAHRPDEVVVWPHPGRHEPDNGKIPGLVFYGSPGDVVRSATSGEVKWAATYWTRGKVVIIKSNDGTLFTYGGNAELLVNVGDRVSAGMDIAKLGESPQGGGAKLYFSISDSSGRAMNPERYLSSKSDS
jgi:murein DD-endopeptidase MepM/ murein hydrolase activator NlpD